MKKFSILFAVMLLGTVVPVFGQDYPGRFTEAFDKNDWKAQEKVLKEWDKAKPNDAELFVSYFNYYFTKGRQETMSLSTNRPNGEAIALTKEGDSNVKAYLGSNVTFVKEDIDAGLVWIDKGIANYPDRLDMRFGKVYALGQIGDYGRFTGEIVKAIERSAVNKNSWAWLLGKPMEQPEQKMLSSIQDYVVQLNENLDDPSDHIRRIAEAVLKIHPDNVENLSNLAVSDMLKKNFVGALVPLLKAEKIAPNDFVILSNIAYCYFNNHDKANAVKYYERLRASGDENTEKDADSKLKEIKNW